MPYYRLAYAPLALLLTISMPSFGQAQGQVPPGVPPGWSPDQNQGTQTQNSQSQQDQDQHRRGQGQNQQSHDQAPQGQSSQVQAPPAVIQNQAPVLSPQGQPPQGQGGAWNQRRVFQGQQSQTQAPPVIQNQAPVLSPQGQPLRRRGSDQVHRRDNSSIQIYRGPDNYRAGSLPSLTQRRNQHVQNRDWYRQSYRAERRYHLRSYRRPRGWYSYDWALGDILPSLFWSRNYWIADYWLYGLPIPPEGCVWVRYDHDALLIDQYTGEVVEVIYDMFY
jgi:Ni/Co efflux regulator RcnB